MMTSKKESELSSNPQGLVDVSDTNAVSEEAWGVLEKSNNVVTKTLVVKHKEDFTGEVTFSYFWERERFNCNTLQYRITRHGGQGGGNKANLHFSIDSLEWWGNDSPDALWQDGEWHSYSRGGYVRANGSARVFARFTFDSSGNDPTAQNSVVVYVTDTQ